MSSKINHKLAHKLKGNHKWVGEEGLTIQQARKYMLCKALISHSGESKDGLMIKQEDVIAGMGAFRLSCQLKMANITIDHFQEKLPKEYLEKYGKEIGNPYPIGKGIDGQHITEGKDSWGEILFYCENPHVYQMIQEGKFKGCSIDGVARNKSCDDNNKCNTEGLIFFENTLILEGVPASDHTWVSVVDEDDIGSIIHDPKIQNSALIEHMAIQDRLAKYIKEGQWKNGDKSILQYLITEKKIEKDTAQKMAKYIISNPEEINMRQVIFLDTDALIGWWQPHEKQLLKEVKEARLFGLDQIGYMDKPTDGENCIKCRFFSSENATDPNGPGSCIFTTDSVMATGGCTDKFELMPGEELEQPPDNNDDNDNNDADNDGNGDEMMNKDKDKEHMEKKKEEIPPVITQTIKPTEKKRITNKKIVLSTQQYTDTISKMDDEINRIRMQMDTYSTLVGPAAIKAQGLYETLRSRLIDAEQAKKNYTYAKKSS